ncbi:MAG: PIN domain-containing protein [Acidobacteriota bacterium]|nr:PIN domain-containing protein [Acidobacteriota bacterium]
MKRQIIVDTGPVVALLNRKDRHHAWAETVWAEVEAPLLTCEAVVAESCYLLRNLDGGSFAVMELIRRGAVALAFSLAEESQAVGRLIKRYRDVPISLADACLVRMSELLTESEVMTLDGDFRIYRRQGRRVIPTMMPGRP